MARLDGVPDALRARILGAVRGVESGVRGAARPDHEQEPPAAALAELLQQAGDGLLALARSAPASREHALTLLAADALMTYAREAEMELDAGGER